MKLWAGRFQKETDTQVNDFNSSILFDQRMYKQDIQGSLAHATMLGRQGIITKEEADDIVNGLTAILQDIEDGKVEFSMENEDIHMNIEAMLTQRIGPDGKRLHTGRSRNDQVAVDFRLYVKSEIPKIIGMLLDLEKVLTEKAKANTETVMPGYTHMQRAQPTTFAHYMMAYANMIRRDITRLEDCLERMDECPLGCRRAGRNLLVSRSTRFQTAPCAAASQEPDGELAWTAYRTGTSRMEFLCRPASILMMHLSRFCEEIIALVLAGSSNLWSWTTPIPRALPSCPRRKTRTWPSWCAARPGRVYGDLMTLLTVMKGLPLAYNKDMQEDKEPVFDAIDTRGASACPCSPPWWIP